MNREFFRKVFDFGKLILNWYQKFGAGFNDDVDIDRSGTSVTLG
jgi:hypothetical protein